jgi:hypothetical protein
MDLALANDWCMLPEITKDDPKGCLLVAVFWFLWVRGWFK